MFIEDTLSSCAEKVSIVYIAWKKSFLYKIAAIDQYLPIASVKKVSVTMKVKKVIYSLEFFVHESTTKGNEKQYNCYYWQIALH